MSNGIDFKHQLLLFESANGRDNGSRRFVNFMLRGGVTPQRETAVRHVVTQTPIRVLSVGHSTTNSTANTLKQVFQPLFGIAVYDVVTATDFVKPGFRSEPYTHVILTGHCHSANGTLEDDDGNRIDIRTIMGKIQQIQNGSEYHIVFYNCQSYSRIYMFDDKAIVNDLMVSNAQNAYFCMDDVLRFGMIHTLPGRLHQPQRFSQWQIGRNPPVLPLVRNMIEFACVFFERNMPDTYQTTLDRLLAVNPGVVQPAPAPPAQEEGGQNGGDAQEAGAPEEDRDQEPHRKISRRLFV